MNKNYPTSLAKQKGITFVHIMLLVGTAVTVAVCAKKGTVPYFQKDAPFIGRLEMPSLPDMPSMPKLPDLPKFLSSTDKARQATPYYPPEKIHTPASANTSVNHAPEPLMAGSKTTQVTRPPKGTSYEIEYPSNLSSGYYTVQVFSGYNSKSAYDLQKALKRDGYRAYIHSKQTAQGILFKVRIGQYTNRSDAFAMNSKIRSSYPKKMSKSFVLLRQ